MRKKNADEGIICPHCGQYSNGDIIDTRPSVDGRRRRRICEHCNKRYTTIEKSIVSKWIVVNNGNKSKLFMVSGGNANENLKT